MSAPKPAKKTGTVEIRVSDEMKAAFAERCRRDEVTVSEAVRRLMERQLRAPTEHAPRGRGRMIVAGLPVSRLVPEPPPRRSHRPLQRAARP